MDINIHPRRNIGGIRPIRPYAVITITDHTMTPEPIPDTGACKGVLKCKFDDVHQPYLGFVHFDDDMADRIWEFVDHVKDEITELHINCEQGRSRSAAVAAAISLYVNGSDLWIWNDKINAGSYRYNPNSLVYKTLLARKGLKSLITLP